MSVRVGVIAVGGRGERLGRIDIQKCLIPLDGKPVVEYVIDAFIASDIRLIILLTGFLHEQISAYLASRCSDEECVLVSSYGGIEGQARSACTLKPLLQNEDFIYAPGDCVFVPQTIERLIEDARNRRNHTAVASVSSDDSYAPEHPGFIIQGKTKLIEEVTRTSMESSVHYMSTGMYYCRPAVFDLLAKIKPQEQFATLATHARMHNQKVSVSVADEPLFYLHTAKDLHAWKHSAMRGLLTDV